NAAYLLISLMIGFIAGVLAGLAVGLSHFKQIDLDNAKVLIGIAVAGYAGSDFIENALSIIIPSGTKPPAVSAAPKQRVGPEGGSNADVQALAGPVNRLTDAVNALKYSIPPAAAAPPILAAPAAADVASVLTSAFRSCAPHVRTDVWVGPLTDAFSKF